MVAALAVLEFLPCLIGPCFGLVGLALTAFWIWMIVDAATKEPAEGNDKVVWLLVVVLLGFIGAGIYYFVRRPERIRKYGK